MGSSQEVEIEGRVECPDGQVVAGWSALDGARRVVARTVRGRGADRAPRGGLSLVGVACYVAALAVRFGA